MFEGSASKIHVFIDLDGYSSSRTIKLNESCTGTRDGKLNCYKDKRNNNIEQIKSAAFKKNCLPIIFNFKIDNILKISRINEKFNLVNFQKTLR